ncbi:MAG: hypothetical protein IJM59_10220 [Proteobacteria bacterium]|nr:hypothetical protein [Pseudomonadota bacterium]
MNPKYFPLLLALCFSACAPEPTFQDDPLCPSCIRKACHAPAQDDAFKSHFTSLSAEEQAQIIAMMEADETCFQSQPWILDFRSSAYENYGHAFYNTAQPMHKIRVLSALDEVLNDTPNRPAALAYLKHHADQWKQANWAAEKLQALQEFRESDDIFALLVRTANKDQLEELAQLDSTPARDDALMYRWQDLSQETQKRALSAWISAAWTMQSSGSSQLPQYLTLDWKRRPFPQGVPSFIAVLSPESIKIQNNEVKRGQWSAVDAFKWDPLTEPDSRHARIDLQPWLTSADSYKISAKATLNIWSPDTQPECFRNPESCQGQLVLSEPVAFERTYKVFVGVETGAPHRIKNDKENAATTKAVSLNICSEKTCLPLWQNGAAAKPKDSLSVVQGKDFYLNISLGNADQPVASRLMARTGNGKVWREIATFFSYAPQTFDVPVRSDIELGELCGKPGNCKLELQLRPSLRMARRDPRIARYWGTTLELGTISLDIQNQTPEQISASVQDG